MSRRGRDKFVKGQNEANLPLVLLSFTTFFAPVFTGFCCFLAFLLALLFSAKTSLSYAAFAQTCWASFLLLPQPLATSLSKI